LVPRDIRDDIPSNRSEPGFTVAPTPQAATSWSPAVFAAIEWRRFEAVCEKLFGQAGFETKSQSHGADGGVDIWLHSRHAEGPVAVVQCKHWQSKAVGVKELREYWRPTCASCGVKLVERTPAKGGAQFWGCSNYPRCKSRLPMVAALR
jgi:hypothetical protein